METPVLEDKRVLLIDDNQLDNFIARMVIKQVNDDKKIVDFQSPIEALEYLECLNSDEEMPEIIFLDINMPIMNGFGFLDEFEKLPEAITKKSKIVVLSSSFNTSDIDKANANRYVIKFLSKPLTTEKYKELLN